MCHGFLDLEIAYAQRHHDYGGDDFESMYEMNEAAAEYLRDKYWKSKIAIKEYTHGDKRHFFGCTEEYWIAEKEYSTIFMICRDLGIEL